LEACIFPCVNWPTLFRCTPEFLIRQKLPENAVQRFSAASFELSGDSTAAFELDGEWTGHLPATFSIEREKLRVIVP
jgi:diacylglycerol kinase family enzyme